jgi:predicted nucleic acid-binding protein
MTDNYFVDSNIWLYGFMESSAKAKIANEIIEAENVMLSTQVINEVCINLIKKAKYSEAEIKQTVHNIYTSYDVALINQEIILYASKIRENNFLSYWDSLIVATAIKNNCTVLYSEDMQHQQVIQNLKIMNPFA